MCGIVGYIGSRAALPLLVGGLARLEYRGYDSAGIAYLEDDGIQIRKRKGRLTVLRALLQDEGLLDGMNRVRCGIGHTRWATHGAPSDENSHPHLSAGGHIAVVHNGIIENYLELRRFLIDRGCAFRSETDSEVIAHLIEYHLEMSAGGDLLEAVRLTVLEVEGSYALGVLCADRPDCFIAARKASPLVIGLAEGGNYIASDIPAILEHTRRILILEDREIARIGAGSVEIIDNLGNRVEHIPVEITWGAESAEKGGFEHFMIKEIQEEPRAVRDTIMPHMRHGRLELPDLPLDEAFLNRLDKVRIVACGTAYHAGMVGKVVIEKICRYPVEVDIASEFRYRDPIVDSNTLVIIISQSGETLDTLAAMREAARRGGRILAVVNVVGSSIAREADAVFYTAAGPEIAVASTKAYNTQLAALYLIAIELGLRSGRLAREMADPLLAGLAGIPSRIAESLEMRGEIQRFAAFRGAQHFLHGTWPRLRAGYGSVP